MSELLSTINQEVNHQTAALATMPLLTMLGLLNDHDASVASAIRLVLPDVEQAVHLITSQLRLGGRLFYVGAGTSGRLAVLDAAECPLPLGRIPH